MNCRGCGFELNDVLIDLGHSAISNDLILRSDLASPQTRYPLKVMVCRNCSFVQLSETLERDALFTNEYVYFSSFSDTWLVHSQEFAAAMIARFKLSESDLIVEVASNDGYLLQYFQQSGISVLGIEPAENVAKSAIQKGIPTVSEFFGLELAKKLAGEGFRPKLMSANNVLAHVPDIHDFVSGFSELLHPEGVISFEFPHLSNLIKENQFDTIYHEHFSYLSYESLNPIFLKYSLEIFDVEQLPTHGGSLRLFVGFKNKHTINATAINSVKSIEGAWNPLDREVCKTLQMQSRQIKYDLLDELLKLKRDGLRVVGYGAAAKGNTLLNYVGIDSDLIDYVVDLNPAKQGKFLPGSLIPVDGMNKLIDSPPDAVLILAWNLAPEIHTQLNQVLADGTKYFVAIPKVSYLL